MNTNEILDMIGEADASYVWDAQQVRSGNMAGSRKLPRAKHMWLIAAIIALMLLLVGCTIAYVQGWFVDFFAARGKSPLSDGQVSYLEANEKAINASQTQNGWTVELRSAISDGTKGIVIFGVTAPEEVSLEKVFRGDIVFSRPDVGNEEDILFFPVGVCGCCSYVWEDDGDGLANTEYFVIEVEPDPQESTAAPFAKDAVWRVAIENILRVTINEEVWDGMEEIFAFDKDLEFTDVLTEGTWEFSFSFDTDTGTGFSQELLTESISTKALFYRRYGEGVGEYANFLENLTVTSFVLKPLTATIRYEQCDGWPALCWNGNSVHAVMKDGREIELEDSLSGGDGYIVLDAVLPIVPEEVDHIRMADGLNLYIDGSVEYPEPKKALPAVLAYQGIPSTTGVYVCYADFDEDNIEDVAVWYDGGFRVLSLLDKNGDVKTSFSFETGMDLVESRIQGQADTASGMNLIKIAGTEDGQPIFRIYRIAEGSLCLIDTVDDYTLHQTYRTMNYILEPIS